MIALFIHQFSFHCSVVFAKILEIRIGEFHHDLRYIPLSLLLWFTIFLFKSRDYWYYYYGPLYFYSLFFFLGVACLVLSSIPLLTMAYCEGGNSFPSPPSPIPFPEEPMTPPESPPVPQPIIPQLPQPLLSEETRRSFLYQRYSVLNLGGSDDLRRMVSIIDAQVIVERYVEAALVDDGFDPRSISYRYRDLRGFIHYPQGELLSARTYGSYITQIREHGTRASVPYRRVMRAVQNYDLLLER